MSNAIPSPFQYRDGFYALAPPWLSTGNAEKYLYTLGLCTDLLLDKCNQAIKIRLPGQGDASQLPYLADDRLLVQGPAESSASFVRRLTEAFETWKTAGSAQSIMGQIQAYIRGLQPGVAATSPGMAIVGGYYPTVATWHVSDVGDAIGAPPALTQVRPSNFNWDGRSQAWRAWLILYMTQVATNLSGTTAHTDGASGGSVLGRNVNGVWVPGVSGTPVNSPFLAVSGLTGLTSANVGMWLALSGSSHPTNNGTFPITAVGSSSTCTIASPFGVQTDHANLTWSIGFYPFIGPGPVWGAPGFVLGQGQSTAPPLDTGANVGGVWQPTTSPNAYGTTLSWGLTCSTQTIQSIRLLLKRWKSAGTYYPDIIVAFDGGIGAPASAYSPLSNPGSGNPDGTFGGRGKLVAGVWVPNRLIYSTYDAYCQGTGTWDHCSVPNIT